MVKGDSEQRAQQYIMKQAFSQQELHEREAVCTRNEPPPCTAACPIHIDARALCAAAAAGDFSAGLDLIRAATPFANLIAKACSASCEGACVCPGDAVAIHRVMQACVLFGEETSKRKLLLPRKAKRIAVAGVGVSALACAWELGAKGYEVLLAAPCDRPADILMSCGLSAEEAAFDLSKLPSLQVEHRKVDGLDREEASVLSAEYDAVCIDAPWLAGCFGQGGQPGNVFAMDAEETRAAFALSAAKSLAITVDRFLQGVTTNEGRDREGPFETDLFVSFHGTQPSKRALADGASLTREGAIAEAARCIGCSCTECLRGCAFLRHYDRDPRKMVREIYNNLSIVMGNHVANGMINSCALCEQCTVLCPNGFEMAHVCQLARNTMVETGKMPPSTHEFALLDMEFSNEDAFLSRPQPGFDACDYVFFPGCQMASITPGIVERTWHDLAERLEGGVGLTLGCCGAIAAWGGHEEKLEATLDALATEWRKMGTPTVIAGCSNCKRFLSRLEGFEVIDIAAIFERIGLPVGAQRAEAGDTVAVHDPCGARGDAPMQDGVRAILQGLGYGVEEMEYARDVSPCCGYGGLVSFANAEVAKEMADFCIAQADAPLVTYCMACRDRFTRNGRENRHVLELLYGPENAVSPDISQRRINRVALKNRLLREVYNEEVAEDAFDFTVQVTAEVAALLEERMILMGDVYEVLKAARASGEIVEEAGTKALIARHRLGNVTFWIKFTQEGDRYTLISAYSHRMTIEAVV